jgi:hypothetical protein
LTFYRFTKLGGAGDKNSLFEANSTEKIEVYKPGNQNHHLGAGGTGPTWANFIST